MYLSLATTMAFFALRAMGLQSLAKSNQIKHSWLAWLPMLNQWVMCKTAGSHMVFNRIKTNHLFGYIFACSSAMSLLFKNRTPMNMVLMILVGILWFYLTYLMFGDFYDKVLGQSKKKAMVAMVVSPLDAIWLYKNRENEQKACSQQGFYWE